jgi:hypothetical protein
MKSCVLDASGRGDHGSRCIGATLRQLAGPADSFSLILGGLHPSELVALPEPTRQPNVQSAHTDLATLWSSTPSSTIGTPKPAATTEQLRLELGALRLGALSKRARAVGVDEGAIEEAVDERDKATLIAQIVAIESSGAAEDCGAAEEQLRVELRALKLGALSKRAAVAGVDEGTIEEAVDEGDKATLITHIVAIESPDSAK